MRELPDRKKKIMHEKNFPCSVQIRFPNVQARAGFVEVCAENFKLVEEVFHTLAFPDLKFFLPAPWAREVFSLDLLAACMAEVVATTCRFIWITKFQVRYSGILIIQLVNLHSFIVCITYS